ncbi:hypothetical protein LPJ56_006458 [Coemansia sp. RSA 2599]|nr:hypothetical protein LPJ56_006469 [Coemansia sp. RSA 2599]KAJ1805960.1 hypothetical protein LPJ56_006458 [Coemansia sp. RSA 2599]
MEEEIERIVSSVFEKDPLVSSVMVVDDSGLCLSKKGPISEEAAGLLASIAARSEVVLPLSSNPVVPKSAVVQIEAENMLILVRRTASVVVGIFKAKPE